MQAVPVPNNLQAWRWSGIYIIIKCRNGHEVHIHDSGKIAGMDEKCSSCIVEVAKYLARHGKKIRSDYW